MTSIQEPIDQKLLAVQARLDLLQKSLIDKKNETVEYILEKLEGKKSEAIPVEIVQEEPIKLLPRINLDYIEHTSSEIAEPYTPGSMRTVHHSNIISHDTISEINSIWKNFMTLCTEGSYVFYIIRSLNLESRLKLIGETLNYADRMKIKIYSKELQIVLEGISDIILRTGLNAKALTKFVANFIIDICEQKNIIDAMPIIKTQISYITADPIISIFVLGMHAKLAALDKISSYGPMKKILGDLSKEIEQTGKTINNTTIHTADLFNVLIKICE
ncbi:MAG: hypothetical protein Harvfovirus4_11 [Harvfovirus sp.]|uniref:Uncharacterized protein n=1 Tax=Harvfovirus sp. TaxID=2487768 RepID=A0A3G5A0D5_9VIRU|nr:MAG: hypothetical protein Harvfovirus4_11 [Harvfovirus sp.]